MGALTAVGLRSTDIALHDVRAGVGDLNGDGRIDLVVSDPYGERAAVRIVFGRESWPETLEEADVTIWDEPAVAGFAEDFDLGADIDGDGFGDLVLGGMDREALWYEAPGRTYLLRGRGASWPGEIELYDEIFEYRAVSFPGSPCATTKPVLLRLPGGATRIAVSQVLCKGHDTVVSLHDPSGFLTEPARIGAVHGEPAGEVFGTSLAAAGDMNGDGWPDLAVGDPGYGGGAYVVLGDASLLEDGETVDVLDLLESGRAVHFTDGGQGDLGQNSEPAGDFNGDGLPDVVFSAEKGGFKFQGRSYIVFGSPELGAGIRNVDLRKDGPTHVRITGEAFDDWAGYGQGVGDVNGDGYSDVAITGLYQETKKPKIHVVLGEREPPPAIDLIALRERGFEITAPEGVDFLGAAGNYNITVLAADLDGDGAQDLVVPYRTALGDRLRVIFGPLIRSGFVRGNANDDATVDISDAVSILGYLFLGSTAPLCLDSADTDDSGLIDLSDAVSLLNHLFQGAGPPAPPYPERGDDPTPDGLGCR